MEILGVVFLHHVLIYRQPGRGNAQFSGPREAQLLNKQWVIFIVNIMFYCTLIIRPMPIKTVKSRNHGRAVDDRISTDTIKT